MTLTNNQWKKPLTAGYDVNTAEPQRFEIEQVQTFFYLNLFKNAMVQKAGVFHAAGKNIPVNVYSEEAGFNAFYDPTNNRVEVGYREGAEGLYAHMVAHSADVELVLQAVPGAAVSAVRLVSANGRIENSQRTDKTYRWNLAAHVPLEFSLANVASCRVRAAGRELTPSRRDGAVSHYRLTAHAARPLEAICQH